MASFEVITIGSLNILSPMWRCRSQVSVQSRENDLTRCSSKFLPHKTPYRIASQTGNDTSLPSMGRFKLLRLRCSIG